METETSKFDPPEGSLRASVGKGALAIGVAQAAKLGMQVISVIVVSRLLAPDDFGLVAMAGPVLAFLAMFQSLGLAQATVQRPKISHDQVNFLFWINVAASVAAAAMLVALSPLVADFYNEPRVCPLIAAMALPVLITGSGAQHAALLNRRMQFGRLALIEVLSGIATLASAITWASIAPSYWALWGSSVCGALVYIVLVWAASPWRPGLPHRAEAGFSLLNFGAGITGFNLANFFARNLDHILIGRYWGGAQLGFYERAYKLLLFPLSQVTNPLGQVMVPALSRMTTEPDRYRHAYLRVMRVVLLMTLPGVAWATAMADTLVPFLLGSQWSESAKIFAALGLAGMVQPLNNPVGWLFISQGRSREFMLWGLATAGFAIAAFGVGITWGAIGIATAYAASEYIKTPILWWYVGRRGPVRWRDMLNGALPFAIGGSFATVGLRVIQPHLPAETLPALLLTLAAAYVIMIICISPTQSGQALFGEARDITARIYRSIRIERGP